MISRTLYLTVMIAAAVAVACSVVTLLALSEKAQAAFPGKNGRIAFSGHRFRLEVPLVESAVVPLEEKQLPPESFPSKPFVFDFEISVRPTR